MRHCSGVKTYSDPRYIFSVGSRPQDLHPCQHRWKRTGLCIDISRTRLDGVFSIEPRPLRFPRTLRTRWTELRCEIEFSFFWQVKRGSGLLCETVVVVAHWLLHNVAILTVEDETPPVTDTVHTPGWSVFFRSPFTVFSDSSLRSSVLAWSHSDTLFLRETVCYLFIL